MEPVKGAIIFEIKHPHLYEPISFDCTYVVVVRLYEHLINKLVLLGSLNMLHRVTMVYFTVVHNCG